MMSGMVKDRGTRSASDRKIRQSAARRKQETTDVASSVATDQFARAFLDALRDILRDEGRRAA
jgi:hypothetical protein